MKTGKLLFDAMLLFFHFNIPAQITAGTGNTTTGHIRKNG